jgi:hypothetical protein
MRLTYQFQKAQEILSGLSARDLGVLADKCRRIQDAENDLLAAAAEKMTRCTTACEGLCCRNVQIDAVIGVWDFVYILTLCPSVAPQAARCLKSETPFFSADCIFLADGVGPCIFPSAIRPEICITAFCTDDDPIKKEVQAVKNRYLKMIWFVRLARIRAVVRSFFKSKS